MNSNYRFIQDLNVQIPEIPPDSIISQTLFNDEQIKAVLFGFAPGQELSEHTASQTALLYFVSGEADLLLGEDELNAQAGTWVHMPPQMPHSIRAKSALLMFLLLLKG